jgi:competence protein ComEA
LTIFTPQERRVVLFLIAALLAGSAVKICRLKERASAPHEVSLPAFLPTVPSDTLNVPQLDTVIQAVKRRIENPASVDLRVNRIDLNTASEKELCLLPGIGPKIAGRIVAYRESKGPFRNAKELMNVPGIGEKKFSSIKDMVDVGERPKAPEDSAKAD